MKTPTPTATPIIIPGLISDGDESFSACCLAGDLGDAFPSGRAGGENSCPGDEDRDGGE